MLDAFIIEEIRRRDGERTVDERPVVQLPVPMPLPRRPYERDEDDGRERDRGGVVIIDYMN